MLYPASALAQQGDLELNVGVLGLWTEREATLAGSEDSETALQGGAELFVRWRSVLGLSARLYGGDFSGDQVTAASGDLTYLNADLFAGHPLLSWRVGFGRRSLSGAFGTSNWSFVRVGGSSTIPAGIAGLELNLAGTIYVDVGGIGAGAGSGRDAEVDLSYRPPGLARSVPLYFILGYRYEQFTFETSQMAGGNRPEKLRSLVLGAGMAFAPR